MCAYRYEKSPQTGEPELVISGWENGIGDSPYSGISYMSGFNIKNSPKTAYSNPARAISTINLAGPQPAEQTNYTVQDPTYLNNLYSVTDKGFVRQSIDGGKTWTNTTQPTTTNAHGNGIFIWGSYLHVIRDFDIDAIAITSAGVSGSWTTMTSNGGTHGMFFLTGSFLGPGQNHYAATTSFNALVYICDGEWISSLNPGIKPSDGTSVAYNPSDNTTYTWNEEALFLQSGRLIATASPNNGLTSTYICEFKGEIAIVFGNFILTWDTVSLQYDQQTFSFPEVISKMVNINNILYCFAGVPTYFNHLGGDYSGIFSNSNGDFYTPVALGRGNIYFYNGFSGNIFKKIPDQLALTYPTNLEPQWLIGGICVYLNKILFGAMDYNGVNLGHFGVYSIDVSTESQAIQYQVAPAPITIENAGTGFPTALCPLTYTQINSNIISYSAGITLIQGDSTQGYRLSYTDQAGNREGGIMITDLIQPGTNLQKKTFNNIEVRFRNPLSLGETVSIYAGKYFNSSLSNPTNPVYTATLNNTQLSFKVPVFIQNNEEFFIKLVTSPIANGSGCPIKEIRVR